jgi:hypothetical protein
VALWEQAMQLLEHVVESARGPLAHEARFRLAEALVRQQKGAQAKDELRRVVEEGGPFAPLAEFHLASLDLDANRVPACLKRCRALLTTPSSVRVADVLTLMGRAYERSGNYAFAAKCYAGELPD